MTEELAATAKQTGIDLIKLSDTFADKMQTWADLLAEDPDILAATYSAGFISNPSEAHNLELVIDVQAPADGLTILRTWAIETLTGDNGEESFNNIQLTFSADDQQVHELLAKGNTITREDIRRLLQDSSTRLQSITVSNESGGDGISQTHGELYSFDIDELSQSPDKVAEVGKTLQTVLQRLKRAGANRN